MISRLLRGWLKRRRTSNDATLKYHSFWLRSFFIGSVHSIHRASTNSPMAWHRGRRYGDRSVDRFVVLRWIRFAMCPTNSIERGFVFGEYMSRPSAHEGGYLRVGGSGEVGPYTPGHPWMNSASVTSAQARLLGKASRPTLLCES